MAVPKRKVSRTRRDKRRSSVWKLTQPAFTICSHCGKLMVPHRVCGSCGFYRDREIVNMEKA